MKLVSIILPVYNGEKYLSQSIDSILKQSYSNFELIIVNDCSTDNSLEVMQAFADNDERIVIINNVINKKLPASLNIGHKRASGKYITWTSDDNILKPNFVEHLLNTLITQEVEVVYSNYDVIHTNGHLKRIHKTGPTEHLLFGNKIGASFLYKKEVFNNLNGFDESLYLLEDYDFWLRASIKFKFFHLEDNLYQYRLHSDSLTSEIQDNKQIRVKYKEGILKLFEKASFKLSWDTETLNLLTQQFLGEPIHILNYFENKNTIKTDILKYNVKEFDLNKVIFGLQLRLRNELMTNKKNHNIKTLVKVLTNEKQLLFHHSFSKKTTYAYVLKCLFK